MTSSETNTKVLSRKLATSVNSSLDRRGVTSYLLNLPPVQKFLLFHFMRPEPRSWSEISSPRTSNSLFKLKIFDLIRHIALRCVLGVCCGRLVSLLPLLVIFSDFSLICGLMTSETYFSRALHFVHLPIPRNTIGRRKLHIHRRTTADRYTRILHYKNFKNVQKCSSLIFVLNTFHFFVLSFWIYLLRKE